MARLEDKIVLIAGTTGAIGRLQTGMKREGGVAVSEAPSRRIDALDVTVKSNWHQGAGRVEGAASWRARNATTSSSSAASRTSSTWRRVLAVKLDSFYEFGALALLKPGGSIVDVLRSPALSAAPTIPPKAGAA